MLVQTSGDVQQKSAVTTRTEVHFLNLGFEKLFA